MSYRDLGVTSLYSKSVTWLLMLVILRLVYSGIIVAFDKALALIIALAYFIPLLVDRWREHGFAIGQHNHPFHGQG